MDVDILFKAIMLGKFEFLKNYFESHGNTEVRGRFEYDEGVDDSTPLHVACGSNQTEIVRLLLEKKANVNAVDEFSQPPLFYAITTENIEIVKLLTEQGADVNIRNDIGSGALDWA